MKYLIALLTIVALSSCIKDKLESESLVFEGKWKWDHSIEYNYDSVNDTVIGTLIPATNYSDTYGYQFLKKGKVITLKNDQEQDKYRLLLTSFKSGLCDDLVGGYKYEIKLNNKDDMTFTGCVKTDTLTVSDTSFTHLPIAKGDSTFPYYKHYFLKQN